MAAARWAVLLALAIGLPAHAAARQVTVEPSAG
jgi:hypothetical protein